MYEVTSLLRGNSKKSEDDDFSWVSSQDFLAVGGEEKITVYFDNNGASQSVDHNWINKLVESGGWKQGLTLRYYCGVTF